MTNTTEHGTCQICERQIGTKVGVLAHHGYQRPRGYHGQTSSCCGARELPFEVSREYLGEHVASQEAALVRMQAKRDAVAAEQAPCVFQYRKRSMSSTPIIKTVEITRDNFAAMRAEHLTAFMQHSVHSFDSLKAGNISRLDREIKNQSDYVTYQRARFDAWRCIEKA